MSQVMHRDQDTDAFLKTEQLLYLRLTFALVCLGFSLIMGFVTEVDLPLPSINTVILSVVLCSLAGLAALKHRLMKSDRQLVLFNACFIGLDVLALTALVHFTRGLESDLYILYLLPIFLSSHVFARRGIFATAGAVSASYVGLLVLESLSFLPYLLNGHHGGGLAAAYAHRLWFRVLCRAAVLSSVAFIWAAFCDHMSWVAQQGSRRLQEQLEANTKLTLEIQSQAAREHLVNSISTAVRSTLDLDKMLNTTVTELGSALKVFRCAIICPQRSTEEPPIWEIIKSTQASGQYPGFSPALRHKLLDSQASRSSEHGGQSLILKADELLCQPSWLPVKADLEKLGLACLLLQPIVYGQDSKGVILLGEQKDRIWSKSEIELAKAVAGQVAIAIEHSRLVASLVQKNQNLDAKNLELRSVQSQLIHQEKMASLGRMVAGIAHELNNPINFVHGNLPYLRQYFEEMKRLLTAFEDLPDGPRQDVERLKKELKYDFLVTDLDNIIADLTEGAERIAYIIKNLRSFSRLDEAELKEASIEEGLTSSLKLLSQYYGRDKIQVVLKFAELPPVLCYPGQLNQVWMNLLSNAAQALSDTAEPRVSVSGVLEGDGILVSVSDNGPGIKDGLQSKIFEPFFTTKPVGQGTGLGLSICHSIMERHGGQIWFESKSGQGTTFKVKVPFKARTRQLQEENGD